MHLYWGPYLFSTPFVIYPGAYAPEMNARLIFIELMISFVALELGWRLRYLMGLGSTEKARDVGWIHKVSLKE